MYGLLGFIGIAGLLCLWTLIADRRRGKGRNTWRILYQGFREGLRGSGVLPFQTRGRSELWVWETLEDEDVCPDCEQRKTWPPLDIADWMKLGLPGTPESETHCGENCRCQLIPYRPRHHSQNKS